MYHGQRNEASAEALVSPAAAQRLLELSPSELKALLAVYAEAERLGRAVSVAESAAAVGWSVDHVRIALRSLAQRGLAIPCRMGGKGGPLHYLPPELPAEGQGVKPISPELPVNPPIVHQLPAERTIVDELPAGSSNFRPEVSEADCMESPARAPTCAEEDSSLLGESGIRNRYASESESESARARAKSSTSENRVAADADPPLSADLSEALKLAFDALGRSLGPADTAFVRDYIEARQMPLCRFREVLSRVVAAHQPRWKGDRIRTMRYLAPALDEEIACIEALTADVTESTNGRTDERANGTDGRGNPKGTGVLARAAGPAGGNGRSGSRPTHTFTAPEEEERLQRLNAELAERYFPARPAGGTAGEAL